MRHSILLSAFFLMPSAYATSVEVAGLLPGKAVLVVNGGSARTVMVGATHAGVKLIAVEEGVAVVEIEGKPTRLGIGARATAPPSATGGGKTVSLTADASGHFYTVGSVNGTPIRFLVDTGATMVTLGAADAVRANIDFRKGTPGAMATANGNTRAWRLPVSTLRIGDVTLYNVDAVVLEHDMGVALLGMSFLNRMEMKREGLAMTLRQRY